MPRICHPPFFSCPTSSSQLCYFPFYSVQLDLLVSTNKQAYARLVFRIPSDFITHFSSILAVTVIGVRLLLFMPGSYYTMHRYIVFLFRHPPIIGHPGLFYISNVLSIFYYTKICCFHFLWILPVVVWLLDGRTIVFLLA